VSAAAPESLLGELASADLLQRLSDESNGHPLFLLELVAHARSGSMTTSG
jgi:hypothetical protein